MIPSCDHSERPARVAPVNLRLYSVEYSDIQL
jgi:hypothetical protein